MKIKATSLKIFLIASLFMLSGKISNAQSYNYYIANDHLTSPTVYVFDVYLQNTSGVDFSIRTIQNCFTFNSAFINGATITVSTVAGSTQLNSYGGFSTVWSATAPGFTTTANGGVSCSNGTIIPASGTPIRVATFKLTATVGAFGCAPANPSMMFTGETATGLSLRTAVTRWDPNANGLCTTTNLDPSSNTTITALGAFTRFGLQTQYSQVNNMHPAITSDPAAASTCSGGSVSYTVTAQGNGTANALSYQWLENGVPIPNNAPYTGVTTATLGISPVPFSSNGHTFSCVVYQCTPSLTDTSLTALLTVNNTDDGNACTTDACNPATGVITHTPILGIDDSNACTTDACDPATGISTHTPVSVDDNNPCTDDACNSTTGLITHTPVNVDDGDACTIDACNSSSSTGLITHTPVNTDDQNACTIDACNSTTGVISHTPVNIDDNNVCTTDACDPATGIVTHTAIGFDDNNVCTTDACDPITGISHTPINISDNNVCTADACDPITGVSHTPISITDNNVCTADACDPITGISHTPVSIDDGNACTTDGCNSITGVFHNPVNTDDGNACTTDACNTSTGLVTHTPVNTDDGNACTIDACNTTTGVVTHTAVNTNDGNACTIDACNTTTGVVTHTAVNTDDGNACTVDACNTSTGNITHTAVNTDDGNACTVDACNTTTGVVTHTALPTIDDNNVCTTDACNTTTGVVTHTPININDNNACTTDACDPITGPSHTPVSTDDGNACTIDGCNTLTGPTHTPVTTDDGNACTVDACNTATGVVSHTAVNTDDGNACTVDACNTSTGVVTHTAVNTDDGNACTVDACNTGSGVITHTAVNIDDSNACTVDACNTTTGVITHTGVNANDGNACTTDACDPITGVTHTPVNTDDGNACTVDGCNTLTGPTHTPVSVNDNDACTTDACNTSTGVITHTAVNTDDNNACTTDGCNSVTGVFHNPVTTNDGNACTTDGCNTLTGVFHNPVNTNDNNACTVDACNSTTGTITHTPVNTDDGNACTTDACNTTTGAVTHTPVNTDDGNACTIDACNSSTGVTHTPVSVDDQNVCTTDACDPATGIVTHTPININDNNPCTEDACDPITGITHPPVNVDDQNICTADACDPQTGVITHTPFSATATSTPASCSGNDGTATAIPVGGTPNYNYSWSPGGQTTNPATSLGPNTYTCFITDAHGCSTTASTTVTSSGTNATPPTQIYGPAGACRGQCGVVYSIDPVPGATSYVWTLPAGATGSSTGTSITVCFNTHYNGGFICVSAVSPCGTSTSICLNVPRITSVPAAPGPISGPTPLCPPASGNYSINPVTNATSYVWSTTGGLIINSGQGTTSINVTAPSGFISGTVKVYAKNCMGVSITRIMTVTGLPGTPVWFNENSGDNDVNGVCAGSTHEYEIHLVPGATCYTWTAPPGAVINDRHGHTGNPLTLNSVNIDDVIITFPQGFVSGFVTVSACNSCGSGAVATLAIHSAPSTPIWKYAPPAFACAGHCFTFNIDNVQDATSWTYSAPPGCVITSPGANHSGNPLTTTVSNATICFPANFVSGDITIYSTNACGNSLPLVYHIQSKPSQPGPISGPSPVCRMSTRTYSVGAVSGASNYIWAVTGGAVILSGQGTTSVNVKFNAVGSPTVIISVRASNTCGATSPSTMTVSIIQNCTPVNARIRSGEVESELTVYPNPTSGKATITFNSGREAKYSVKVVDMIGRVMIDENISAVEGFNIKEINLENFSKGLYFVSVQAEGDEAQTLRLVVE